MASEMSSSMHSRRIGPHGTPESEFSIECFQNYTGPEVFIQGLAGIVNQGDVELMIRAQKQMLQRFEKTNEMLLNCNALSASRLKTAGEDFKKHIKLLNEMKKDLDYIFKKIRIIKTKLNTQYPQAFQDAQPQRNSFAEEAEDSEEVGIKSSAHEDTTKQQAASSISKNNQTPDTKRKHINSSKSLERETTVEYVPMEHSPENGRATEEKKKLAEQNRRSLQSDDHSSSTDNSNISNDSSDATSDTG